MAGAALRECGELMRTWMKIAIGIVAACAFVGAGYAAASGAGGGANGPAGKHGRPGPLAVFRLCKDDAMTIGQCKDLVEGKIQSRIDAAYQKCMQNHDQSFCDAKKQKAEDRLHAWRAGGGQDAPPADPSGDGN